MDANSVISDFIADAEDEAEAINYLTKVIFDNSPFNVHPVNQVRWIHIDQVEPNDYNPNKVAKIEMQLLYTSIDHDGYTQPVVTIYDPDRKKYIIVDGFHRKLFKNSN